MEYVVYLDIWFTVLFCIAVVALVGLRLWEKYPEKLGDIAYDVRHGVSWKKIFIILMHIVRYGCIAFLLIRLIPVVVTSLGLFLFLTVIICLVLVMMELAAYDAYKILIKGIDIVDDILGTLAVVTLGFLAYNGFESEGFWPVFATYIVLYLIFVAGNMYERYRQELKRRF